MSDTERTTMGDTELQIFLERARQVGAWQVLKFYELSYLPWKAALLEKEVGNDEDM